MLWQVWRKGGHAPSGALSRPLLVALFLVAALGASFAQAESWIDSEHIFGFTEGSDIGSKGEKELKNETTLRSGKAAGSFTAVTSDIELKYTLLDNFRLSAGANLGYFDVSGVPGI